MIFNRKRTPPIRTLIGEGTVLSGDLTFSDGLRIDGHVHGDVCCADGAPSIVVISDKASVHGRVKAGHVIINGEVRGPVECSGLVELQPAARVFGNVRYEVLEMHPGAQIDGELRPIKNPERPALKLAASNDA
ncbi:MAG TPA: polymer-forming cytoskeletal protein [Rubrivivax sp.]